VALEPFYPKMNAHLSERGLLMRQGTIVDATILAAPSFTKNADRTRDPEMHQTKKGNNWHFGMKTRIGVDADSGLVHTVYTTSANAADISEVHHLLHGVETEVFADSGYVGASKRDKLKECQANWNIAARSSSLKRLKSGPLYELVRQLEHVKVQIRVRVEHSFHIIKNLFHHKKVRYRGLAKNTA
jgi:IS5 family transposase